MMKKIVLCSLLLAAAMIVHAVPARPGWQTRTQADGTTIEVQQFGDEYYSFMLNREGKQVRENEQGMFEVVGDAPTVEETKSRRSAGKARKASSRKATGFGVTPYLPPKVVVIMVNFKDTKFKSSTTKAVIDEMCNSHDCTVNRYAGVNYGSIAQYFRDQSYGKYAIQFDVYGPVTLDSAYSYYGKDWQYEGDDRYPGNAVIEACKKADSEIDFSQYDWNKDGEVDVVYIVYAGRGQADGGNSNTIWPHSYEITSSRSYGYCTYTKSQCTFDNKVVDSYAISNELSGSSLAGIGIICHEYGHVMGLPDFYDTSYGTNATNKLTPNDWDVMDGGSYNGDIHCPPNYNPWERHFLGWETPKNLGNTPQRLSLVANGSDGYKSYQINAKGTQQSATSSGLCYYIENRRQQGWDTYLPYNGLVVWKLNYLQSLWEAGTPNSTYFGDPHFTLVSASGTAIGGTNGAKNVFPYGSTNSWSGVSGKPLLNITRNGELIDLIYIRDPHYTVTWMVNGEVLEAVDYPRDGSGDLQGPTKAVVPCEGTAFVGWTTESEWLDPFSQPEDLFTEPSGKVTNDVTYYAVFK